MDDELRQLYQEVILDHGRTPRNHYVLSPCDFDARGFNPLCGDEIHIYICLNKDKQTIENISFSGHGCAISQASASLLTEVIKGKTLDYFTNLLNAFIGICTGSPGINEDTNKEIAEDIDRLMVLAGVSEFPSRVKCATLAWHALETAIKKSSK